MPFLDTESTLVKHWLSLCIQPEVMVTGCLLISNADRTYWEELPELQVGKSSIAVQQPKMWAQLLKVVCFSFGVIDLCSVVGYCLLEPAYIITTSHSYCT